MSKTNGELSLSDRVSALLGDITQPHIEATDEISSELEVLERPGVIHQAAAMYIQGMTARDIASNLGVSPTSVRMLFRKQTFKDISNDMSLEVVSAAKTIVRTNTLKAAEVLGDLLDNSDAKIRKSAADSILDRAGVKGTDKVEITTKINNLNIFTDEEILLQYMADLQAYETPKNVEGVEYDVTDDKPGD